MNKVFFILIIFLFPKSAFAACLEGNPSVSIEYSKSFAVFIGKVLNVTYAPETGKYYEGHNYLVQVGKIFKGNLNGEVTIFNENSSGRFPMAVGEKYILFVYNEVPEIIQVDNCGNSGLLSERKSVVNEIEKQAIKK